MQPVPGDLIEWCYGTGVAVVNSEQLYSSTMKQWVQIGNTFAMLISIDKEHMFWLTKEGLFHARVDDMIFPSFAPGTRCVVPRARG